MLDIVIFQLVTAKLEREDIMEVVRLVRKKKDQKPSLKQRKGNILEKVHILILIYLVDLAIEGKLIKMYGINLDFLMNICSGT